MFCTVARSYLQFFSVHLSVFANEFKKPVAQLVVIKNIEIRRQRRGIRRRLRLIPRCHWIFPSARTFSAQPHRRICPQPLLFDRPLTIIASEIAGRDPLQCGFNLTQVLLVAVFETVENSRDTVFLGALFQLDLTVVWQFCEEVS